MKRYFFWDKNGKLIKEIKGNNLLHAIDHFFYESTIEDINRYNDGGFWTRIQ